MTPAASDPDQSSGAEYGRSMRPTPNLMPTASTRAAARLGLRLLWRRRTMFIPAVVLLLAGTASMLLIPRLLGAIVDAVVAGEPFSQVLWFGGALAGAGVAAAALGGIGGVLLVRCLQSALAELRELVFSAALGLPLRRVEDAGDADLISRVTNDVEAITEAISGVIPLCVRSLFTIALTVFGLALLNPWLALAALAAVPIQVVSTIVFMRRSRPLYARLRREEAERGRVFVEAVSGADTVRAYGTRDSHLDRIAHASETAVRTHLETARARNIFIGGLNSAEFVGLAAVLAVGFVLATTTGLSVGAVTAAALYFHRLFGPIGDLLGSMDDLQRALAGLQRLAGVVQLVPESAPGAADGTRDPHFTNVTDASVELRAVGYRYGSEAVRDALQEVTLTIPAGDTVALIGSSGSGKSTIARLIAGFDDPLRGSVSIGGAPAGEAMHSGRPAVMLVAQETYLFSGTIADNVRIAAPHATDAELVAALACVGCDVARFDGGLDATLSASVSHRDAQQIALARVLLADPHVVVLDEAGSQAGADGVLTRAIAEVTRDRTAVVVAHHMEQVAGVDTVVVCADGRIVESGAPAELREREGGAFARLWRMSRGGQG